VLCFAGAGSTAVGFLPLATVLDRTLSVLAF
jgi:hypothetical protein